MLRRTLSQDPAHARGEAVIATPDKPLLLHSGDSLSHASLAYEVFGPRDADQTVLICHALTGDAHVTRHDPDDADEPMGWWESIVGPGKAIDTDTTRVICSNVLGGCAGSTGPTSVNPRTGFRHGPDFPAVTIADMVTAQKRLLDHLGIEQRVSVVGGSIGGLQVLEWIRAYPEHVAGAAVIASGPALNAYGLAHNEIARNAIRADGDFKDGWYTPESPPIRGLAAARKLAHLTYRTGPDFERRFGRRIERNQFSVASYLAHKGDSFINRFDANTYLTLIDAMDEFDGLRDGDLESGLRRIDGPFLSIGFTSDLLFPTAQAEQLDRIAKAVGIRSTLEIIKTEEGHDSFLLPNSVLSDALKKFSLQVQS